MELEFTMDDIDMNSLSKVKYDKLQIGKLYLDNHLQGVFRLEYFDELGAPYYSHVAGESLFAPNEDGCFGFDKDISFLCITFDIK